MTLATAAMWFGFAVLGLNCLAALILGAGLGWHFYELRLRARAQPRPGSGGLRNTATRAGRARPF